jgi:hypothetical protein
VNTKLTQPRKTSTVPKGRFKLLAGGVLLALVGHVQLHRGAQVTVNWTGQPLFAWGLVAAGTVCVLLGIVPTSVIQKASTHRRRN